ncbi:MAG: hypothetical protein ACI9KE_000621 [Polyangiales bacterium]|jgi:hypothetical protein
MNEEGEAPPKEAPFRESPRLGPLRALGWLFVFGLVAGGVLVGALAYRMLAPPPEPIETIIRETPDVVRAVQDLARLESARMHMERVVDLRDRGSSLFGLVETEDAILLVAAADVSAGVDLTRMQDGDVVIEPDIQRATIVLPPPEIFEARLDNEHTYVHTRETSALAEPSSQLETRARQEAERTLRTSALDAGLLERARQNAKSTIEVLVRSLGFDEVRVRFSDEPELAAETTETLD